MRISDIPWETVQQELLDGSKPLPPSCIRLLDEVFFAEKDTGEPGDFILVFGLSLIHI